MWKSATRARRPRGGASSAAARSAAKDDDGATGRVLVGVLRLPGVAAPGVAP